MLTSKKCIPYKPNRILTSGTSKCSKTYIEYADICRMDASKCGKEGKYFEEEPHLHRKILIHNLLYAAPFVASCAVTVVFLFPLVDLLYK